MLGERGEKITQKRDVRMKMGKKHEETGNGMQKGIEIQKRGNSR